MSNLLRIVALSGNVHRPSKSRTLAAAIADAIATRIAGQVEQYDILDCHPGLGTALARAQLPGEPLRVLESIEQSDVLVIATPTYKATYPGLFKHLIDFVDPKALDNRIVVISATGAGKQHALVVEHQLRPLFAFFGARVIPTGIFASDDSFSGDALSATVGALVEKAAEQVALQLS